MYRYLISILILILAIHIHVTAQQDTLSKEKTADTVSLAPKKNKKNFNPKTATLLSIALPGAGQVYNRRYWKLPILYVGAGVLIYFLQDNHYYYKGFKDYYDDTSATVAYRNRLGNIAAPQLADSLRRYFSENPDRLIGNGRNIGTSYERLIYSPEQAKRARDLFYRNYQLNIIGLIGIYVLQIIDAHVDAHLKNFDVNDNLSLDINPTFKRTFNNSYYANLTITLKFKK